ncbi:MAG: acetyltransferase [Syntrophobacteraceae bacterium]
MKRLLIIGAGGFGRELLGWSRDIPFNARDWAVGGFLDANPAALDGYQVDLPILGDPMTISPSENDVLTCAIGDPKAKLRIVEALKRKGGRFISIIHPTAVVGPLCRLGEGCILCPAVVITTNVTIGDFVTVNVAATVGHDVVVGEGCTICGHADITGAALLGKGVFVGSHASILPKASIGDYAIVGAGSVVLRKVREGATVMGVPAKQVAGFDFS